MSLAEIKEQIAGARLVVLPDCMHSIQTERPQDCARLIREFGTMSLTLHSMPQTGTIAARVSARAGN